MPAFPSVRVADPIPYEALTVFPLFTEPAGGVDYLLADEAIHSGSVTVEEVTESGSVPNLQVDNKADTMVLFLEGEELRGAKQNRVLNTSVLIAARTRTTIPVSCVEQGRWRYLSRHFGSSDSYSSSKLRHILKKSVTQSAREGHGHTSAQGEVWGEVGRQMASLGACSPTSAMADTYATMQHRLDEFRDRLQYVEGASGLAVAVGGRVAAVDLFDKPATCRKVWDRLLTGLVMEAVEAGAAQERPDRATVEAVVASLGHAPWQPTPPVGVGEELRAEMEGDRHATALLYSGAVVHGSLVAG